MNISLEEWLRNKVDELERMHEYSIATDDVRDWIDQYNDLVCEDVFDCVNIVQEIESLSEKK